MSEPLNPQPSKFSKVSLRGPLAWMASNPVASNLLMLVLLLGGMFMTTRVKQEVFPEFNLDMVLVDVAYPGASPSEVEQGVLLALEEAIRGVDGVKELNSEAAEGHGILMADLELGADSTLVLADIKSAVDRVASLPKESERPVVSLASNKMEVLSMILYGDVSEGTLRNYAETLREELLQQDKVSSVKLTGVRPLEVSVEISQEMLRTYGLTLEAVSQRITAASVELPGGGIKTDSGEILIRTDERRRNAAEFSDIVILSRADGAQVRLGDIATVVDGYRDTNESATFNGHPAVKIGVLRSGKQTPIAVSEAVNEFVVEAEKNMPEGLHLASFTDTSEWYSQRLDLLSRNAISGLILVFVVLSLFLEIRLAFWVTLGIPISFAGSILFMSFTDASINMISLFAFIVTLGMVVDDAIVVGESIYHARQQGYHGIKAAIHGVRQVAIPVVFAVMTTMVAFAPMLFVPGAMGKFFRLIPIVVISVLGISLIEGLFILPAHLSHTKEITDEDRGALAWLIRRQKRFSDWFESWIVNKYGPAVRKAVVHRYAVVAAAVVTLMLTFGIVIAGIVKFTFLPKVEGDLVVVELQLPFGAPLDQTEAITQKLVEAGQAEVAARGGEEKISRGMFAHIGATGSMAGGDRPSGLGPTGSHLAEVVLYLQPAESRDFTTKEFTQKWRERVGEIAGLERLKFQFDAGGPTAGAPVFVELSHRDLSVLELAAADVADGLRGFGGGVFDIDDGFTPGKEQINFKLKAEARAYGLTEIDVGRQLRAAYYGAEAVREQRGRDEVRVLVRLPEEERSSESSIEQFLLRTPSGSEVPLFEVADIQRARAYTSIKRRAGRRVVNVTSDLEPSITNANDVTEKLDKDVLPDIVRKYPGLRYSFRGEQKSQDEVNSSLGTGNMFAIVVIYAMLAIVFRSYSQPLIILSVIPFGLVGAVAGHAILNYDLSMMSTMGIVALSGVVINDSLILIEAINIQIREGEGYLDAITNGSVRRFRPILLTSLTTFFGLIPMLLEKSPQALFLIPMAVSLAFGVLFATVICLLIVPALYHILFDIFDLFGMKKPHAPETEEELEFAHLAEEIRE